ncbi:MAG: anti-sigma factor [bacterium]
MTDDFGALIRESLPSHKAPDALRAWAHEQAQLAEGFPSAPTVTSVTSVPRRRGTAWFTRRGLYAAGLVAAALLGWSAARVRVEAPDARGRDVLIAQLVDTHVRSLMLNHLTDVQSTDQHTVKPWFAGKTDVAPRVVELASSGFPLLGGRLDYVQGHTTATLVYGRRRHIVNLFIWPDANAEALAHGTYHGYALLHWSAGGTSYWAVSDAAPSELDAFQHAYQSAP